MAAPAQGKPPARMAFLYMPNGVHVHGWWPEKTGRDFELSPTLQPPAGLRESIRGRPSDLSSLNERPSYQLLVFEGCYTEEYLHSLRDPSTFKTSMIDTDVIATQAKPRYSWTGQPALRFLDGLTSRETNDSMFAGQAKLEQQYLRNSTNIEPHEIPAAGHTFVESGFLENEANRIVETEERI